MFSWRCLWSHIRDEGGQRDPVRWFKMKSCGPTQGSRLRYDTGAFCGWSHMFPWGTTSFAALAFVDSNAAPLAWITLLPPQSSNLIEVSGQFPFSLNFRENISSCNRGWRSSCKTGASYEELARCIRISGSFAGGRNPTERQSIDVDKSEPLTRFLIWRLLGKRRVFWWLILMRERQNRSLFE